MAGAAARSLCFTTDHCAVEQGARTVYVRDSKAVEAGPVLRIGRDGWAAFVGLAAK
ncbi:DUF397 domain-containing protein [Streptomyces cellulosae]